MKKIYLMAFAVGAFSFTATFAQVDQTEDFEGFAPGLISSQSDLWKTWSGEEGGVEDGIVSLEQANSGFQSLMIDEVDAPAGKDQLYLFDNQPDSGIYSIKLSMFIPRSEEHTSELQSRPHLVCRLLL